MIELSGVAVGSKLRLVGGITAEVLEIVNDEWAKVRLIEVPRRRRRRGRTLPRHRHHRGRLTAAHRLPAQRLQPDGADARRGRRPPPARRRAAPLRARAGGCAAGPTRLLHRAAHRSHRDRIGRRARHPAGRRQPLRLAPRRERGTARSPIRSTSLRCRRAPPDRKSSNAPPRRKSRSRSRAANTPTISCRPRCIRNQRTARHVDCHCEQRSDEAFPS